MLKYCNLSQNLIENLTNFNSKHIIVLDISSNKINIFESNSLPNLLVLKADGNKLGESIFTNNLINQNIR